MVTSYWPSLLQIFSIINVSVNKFNLVRKCFMRQCIQTCERETLLTGRSVNATLRTELLIEIEN